MLKVVALAFIFGGIPLAFAGVTAYSGSSGDKLFIEEASSLGTDKYLIKFVGVESPWANKVIETRKEASSNSDKFVFDYDLDLSGGVQKRKFALVVETGSVLVQGSLVKKLELFYAGMPDKRVGRPFSFDKNLTESSVSIDLISEHRKSLFRPTLN